MSGLFGAVFSGWLADAKLGNYRVMKYCFVLLFFLCLLSSAFTLVPDITHYVYVVSVLSCIGVSLLIIAGVACSVTSLQLGLDQMPDASSSNIIVFGLLGAVFLCLRSSVFTLVPITLLITCML